MHAVFAGSGYARTGARVASRNAQRLVLAALAALSFTALAASPQIAAAQGVTCPDGFEACEKNCMKAGDVCCPGGDFSCPAGQACIGSGKDATCSEDSAGGCPENTEPCTEKELLEALKADGLNTTRGPVKNWAKQVAAQRCKPEGGTCCTGLLSDGSVSAYGCGEGNVCGEGEQDNACCPEAGCETVTKCDEGEKLCGSGCIPETAECCGGTAFCNAGSTCREQQTCTDSCPVGSEACGEFCTNPAQTTCNGFGTPEATIYDLFPSPGCILTVISADDAAGVGVTGVPTSRDPGRVLVVGCNGNFFDPQPTDTSSLTKLTSACTPSGQFVCVTTPEEDKIECQQDSDCPAPTSDTQISFCAAYECHTLDKCDGASAGGGTCTQDEDCGVSGTCNNGTCSNPCNSDDECGASDATTLRLCKDGFCSTSPRDEDRIPECYEDVIPAPATNEPETDLGGDNGDDSGCATDADCEASLGAGATCSQVEDVGRIIGVCNPKVAGFDCADGVCTSTDENAEPFACPSDNPNCTVTPPVGTGDSCEIKFVVQGVPLVANAIETIFYEITGGGLRIRLYCPSDEIYDDDPARIVAAARNLAAEITEIKKIPTAAEYDAGAFQDCTDRAVAIGANCTAKDSEVSGCLFRVHPAQTGQNVAWTAFATLTLLGLLRAFRPRRRG